MVDQVSEAPVATWRLMTRATRLLALVTGHASRAGARAVGRLATGRPRDEVVALLSADAAEAVQALGPTFIKFGQIASSRRDALPPVLCDALSDRLHDAVQPMSSADAREALADRDPRLQVDLEPGPMASGSIASVFRGIRTDTGEPLAVKIKRPGIDAVMHADLALVEALVRLAEKAPGQGGLPLADLVGYVSRAIVGQLDFDRELRNAARLRVILESLDDVVVPRLHLDLCRPGVLVFDHVPGLRRGAAEELPDARRRELGETLLAAVHTMIFDEGFLHCDLHPGNVYVRERGLVLLDAGYCVQLPDHVRKLMGEFFYCLVNGYGRSCGEIVLASAVNPWRIDREQFVLDMAALVADHVGPDVTFDLARFGDDVFRLQQRYRIWASSDFAFPLMSMNVLDGTLRRISTDVDVQRIGEVERAKRLHLLGDGRV